MCPCVARQFADDVPTPSLAYGRLTPIAAAAVTAEALELAATAVDPETAVMAAVPETAAMAAVPETAVTAAVPETAATAVDPAAMLERPAPPTRSRKSSEALDPNASER